MWTRALVVILVAVVGLEAVDPCSSLTEGQVFAANPRGCAWFFYCEDPTDPLEGRCPEGFYLNVQTQRCSYPDVVSPRCTFDEEILARTYFECPNSLDMRIIPHPFACGKYTLCWEGKWQDFSCPPEFPHFSLYDNACNTDLLADCRAVKRFCDASPIEQFRVNPHSCDDYLMCTECNNEYSLLHWNCPVGYRFSQSLGICVTETGFMCHVEEFDSFVPPPEPFTIDCTEGSSSIFRPHPNDCDFYFICATRTANSILERCPEGTKFSVAVNRCVRSENAVCVNARIDANRHQRKAVKMTNVVPKIDV